MQRRLSLWKDRILEHAPFVIIVLGTVSMPLLYAKGLRAPLVLPKELLLLAVVSMAAFFWCLRAIIQKQVHIRKSVLDVPLFLFGFFVVISSIFAANWQLSFLGAVEEYTIHTLSLFGGIALVWLLIQELRTQKRWELLLAALFIGTGISVVLFLLASQGILTLPVINTVSSLTSVVGVYYLATAIVAGSILLLKKGSRTLQVLATILVAMVCLTLLRIDFSLLWGLFAAGMTLLVLVATMHLRDIRTWIAAVGIVCSITSVWFYAVKIPAPLSIRTELPVEVTLHAATSWHIVKASLIESPTALFIGHGPSSFVRLYSQYRPASMNVHPLAGSVRFAQPYNVFLDIIGSIGLLGVVSFAVIMFILVGILFSSIVQSRKTAHAMFQRDTPQKAIALQGMGIGVAWVVVTISFGFIYADAALWLLWWWLLGVTFVGVSVSSPRLLREKMYSLRLSDGQQLIISFVTVGMVVAIAIVGVFSYRYVYAEQLYTQAVQEHNVLKAKDLVEKSVSLRPAYMPYTVALAQLSLEAARQESEKVSPDQEAIITMLASAVNSVKKVSEDKKADVSVWETLTLLYMNSRVFAPEANDWAMQAVDTAILLEPSNPTLFLQAGNIHEFAKRYQDAGRAYEHAIELNEDDMQGYLQLAALFDKQGDVDDAITMYERILDKQPHMETAQYQLGRVLYNRGNNGDYARAQALWEAILTTQPRHVNALYSLGLLYEQQRQWGQARMYYQQILSITPDNADVQKRLNALR